MEPDGDFSRRHLLNPLLQSLPGHPYPAIAGPGGRCLACRQGVNGSSRRNG